MSASIDNLRFDELATRYFEAALDEAGLLELDRLLAENKDLAARFLLVARIHGGLREIAAATQKKTDTERRTLKITTVESERKRHRLPYSRRQAKATPWRQYWIVPVAAAAAAFIFCLYVFKTHPQTKVEPPAAVAEVTGISGPVTLVRASGSAPAQAGTRLLAGEGLQTGSSGRARLCYADGTALDLEKDTTLSLQMPGGAKQVKLNAGKLSASVAVQPEGKPMLYTTPFGEACVLGTQLSLAIEGQSARLDVAKGKVRFTNVEKKAVEVETGNYAVASAGVELKAKPIEVAVAKKVPAAKSAGPEVPYGNNGQPWPIPGLIFCSNYDSGGEGVGYHSELESNCYGNFGRGDGVGVVSCYDAINNGLCVGAPCAGQWLNYTVNIAKAGNYHVIFQASSGRDGGNLHLEIDGVAVTGALFMPVTGNWEIWKASETFTVPLPAGRHVLRIFEESREYKLNWMNFEPAEPVQPDDF